MARGNRQELDEPMNAPTLSDDEAWALLTPIILSALHNDADAWKRSFVRFAETTQDRNDPTIAQIVHYLATQSVSTWVGPHPTPGEREPGAPGLSRRYKSLTGAPASRLRSGLMQRY